MFMLPPGLSPRHHPTLQGTRCGQRLLFHTRGMGAGEGQVAFTGSVATGQAVMGMAARGPRPVGLELGGKSPLVVFSDAHIESAVEWAMFGAFWTNGQVRSTQLCGGGSAWDDV
jgi:hypothetical protein